MKKLDTQALETVSGGCYTAPACGGNNGGYGNGGGYGGNGGGNGCGQPTQSQCS